ncbi:serine acetyltransferase [Cetobacterium somerae]
MLLKEDKIIDLFFYLKIKSKTNFLNKIFVKILRKKLQNKYGCFIGYNSKITGKINFPHQLYGVFISDKAKIGNQCTIFHQVTIGSNFLEIKRETLGAPEIGDNVYIGAGAKIIGNIKIGNNVKIGANCVVVNDIPNNSTVVLNKPRIIIKENV